MINGIVTSGREIEIAIDVVDKKQALLTVEAVVDTGFNGYLTLPKGLLSQLRASRVGTRRVELGDGNLVDLDVYLVDVEWFGRRTDVLALNSDSKPLVGMSMLWGSKVMFEAVEGGEVRIDD